MDKRYVARLAGLSPARGRGTRRTGCGLRDASSATTRVIAAIHSSSELRLRAIEDVHDENLVAAGDLCEIGNMSSIGEPTRNYALRQRAFPGPIGSNHVDVMSTRSVRHLE